MSMRACHHDSLVLDLGKFLWQASSLAARPSFFWTLSVGTVGGYASGACSSKLPLPQCLSSRPQHSASMLCLTTASSGHQLGPLSVPRACACLQVVGAPLAAALLSLDGCLGLAGWQWLFVVEGLPTIALGLWMRTSLCESPAKAHFLSPEEREWVQQRVSRGWVGGVSTALPSTAHVMDDRGDSVVGVAVHPWLACCVAFSDMRAAYAELLFQVP